MKIPIVFALASGLCVASCFSQNCFTILAGKNASSDGSVFIAHNEDDLNDHNFFDLHKVPRIRHAAGEKQIFLNSTDSLGEVAETFGYFWITGSKYVEDQYLNEWGVAITSNSSQSKVQNGNGRIDHNLRRIVIERARTAREAVRIAGSIVEKYGYASSGRVYAIADPNEAWVFEVANGKHWIARRVPDDEVAIIPNYYVIDDFHEADTMNFLASKDIISYAMANGWYDSNMAGPFNFRKVYGHGNRLDAIWNIARKWVILSQFTTQQYDVYADFPFSIKPNDKIGIQTLIDALGNHYEGTRFASDTSLNFGSPHRRSGLGVNDSLTVCNLYNDFSCIIQLRNWLPVEIGNVVWISPRYPCIQPFIPWYYGIKEIAPDYEKAAYTDALKNFNNRNRNYIEMYPDHACWVFDDFANRMDSCYGRESRSVRDWKSNFQLNVFTSVNDLEAKAVSSFDSDRDGTLRALTDLSNGLAERALAETRKRLTSMKSDHR
jgi:dipeptidase